MTKEWNFIQTTVCAGIKTPSEFAYVMRLDHEADPAVVDRQQEVAAVKVNADVTTAKQEQRVNRHHGRVANEHLHKTADKRTSQCQNDGYNW